MSGYVPVLIEDHVLRRSVIAAKIILGIELKKSLKKRTYELCLLLFRLAQKGS